jgi:hypothetical protein
MDEIRDVEVFQAVRRLSFRWRRTKWVERDDAGGGWVDAGIVTEILFFRKTLSLALAAGATRAHPAALRASTLRVLGRGQALLPHAGEEAHAAQVANLPRVDLSASDGIVIASDSDAIQTKPRPQTLRLDCFALLAMTAGSFALTPQTF